MKYKFLFLIFNLIYFGSTNSFILQNKTNYDISGQMWRLRKRVSEGRIGSYLIDRQRIKFDLKPNQEVESSKLTFDNNTFPKIVIYSPEEMSFRIKKFSPDQLNSKDLKFSIIENPEIKKEELFESLANLHPNLVNIIFSYYKGLPFSILAEFKENKEILEGEEGIV